MVFLEALPTGCPPQGAEEIVNEKTVYRLVAADPPTEWDFQTHLPDGRSSLIPMSVWLVRFQFFAPRSAQN